MIEESKFCNDIMKKHFNKKFVMSQKDDEDFENSNKCWICDNVYVESDVKVRNHCHILVKYGSSAHRDCNINGKLNNKIPIVFRKLKNYDSHLIMQKLGKFDFKIHVIPNRLEMYMSSNITYKLIFIHSFQFLSFAYYSLVKSYVLCPSHYLNAPALKWDAMLNMRKVELKLILDAGMYLFFEKDMTIGVFYISKR